MIPKNKLVAVVAALGLVAACRAPAPVQDASAVGPEAHRIVSLIPAATEILFALGAEDRLVGRTRWGVHPPEAVAIPSVGDGIRPSVEAVLTLEPDLVVVYDGVENRPTIDRFASLGVRTLPLRHDTLGDLMRNIDALGQVAGCPRGAASLVGWIEDQLREVAEATASLPRRRVYYETWADPPMTVGRGSFLDTLVSIGGGQNVFGELPAAAPRVSLEAIVDRSPDRVLVSGSTAEDAVPPSITERSGWDQVAAVRQGQIGRLDRDLVGRLGPRVGDAAWAVARAIHPELGPRRSHAWEGSCGA